MDPEKMETFKLVLVIKAESAGFEAGNFAKIYVNDFRVKCFDKNEKANKTGRGLHIVILNPSAFSKGGN